MAKRRLSEALQRLLERLDKSYPDGGFILIGMPECSKEAEVTIVSNLDPTSICRLCTTLSSTRSMMGTRGMSPSRRQPATQGVTVH